MEVQQSQHRFLLQDPDLLVEIREKVNMVIYKIYVWKLMEGSCLKGMLSEGSS
jgi:hypothetical protein